MSSAPECVSIRHRGSYDFETHYCSLCALQDTVPLLEVKAHLVQGVLDVNGDKIRLADWSPILNTLRINKNLRFIAVRSYYTQSTEKSGDKKSHYFKRRMPAIQSKDLTLRLAQAISECLKQTESLKCLDLQGVPFRSKDLAVLSKGLERNKTLTHLSLEYCQVGDQGCEQISESLKHHLSLTHLNFTGCCLTCKSAETISKLIKHQSTERHSEAWVDSLRYRQPNLNSMTGLRRITLNHNPLIGDEGMCLISDALKDDLWLKALDLQKCGIGREGANQLLETLHQNKTLLVLDVRFNPLIDRTLLHSVIGQVLINSNGYDDKEFPWIKCELPKDPYRTRPRRKCRQIGNMYGRKISVRAGFRQTSKQSRAPQVIPGYVDPGNEGFVPWRTAYRASQYKKTYSDGERIGTPRYLQNPEVHHAMIEVDEEVASVSDEEIDQSHDQTLETSKTVLREPHTSASFAPNIIRELKIELLEARKTVAEERKSRHLAEQHAMNLEVENVRLKKELREKEEMGDIRSVLDDENLLESIENSFNKFHDFLDLLKQLGLGGLVAYAGMSNISFPLGGNETENVNKNGHHTKETKSTNVQKSKTESSRPSSQSKSPEIIESELNEVAGAPPPITIHSNSVRKTSPESTNTNGKQKKPPKLGQGAGDAS